MPVAGPLYPVNLVLTGRPCLVVGGGPVAAAKARDLAECGADVLVVAPEIGPEVRDVDGITWDERDYQPGEAASYRLVLTAADDPEVNRAVFTDGDDAGVWVNSADDPDNCSFVVPARIRRGPLLVSISTEGHSPALANWLRRALEAQIGPEYETAIELLSEARRQMRAGGQSTESADWRAALDSGMLDLIREGRTAEAKELLEACLSSSSG